MVTPCLKWKFTMVLDILGITWVTMEDAVAKYSLAKPLILQWVKKGVVRAVQTGDEVVRVNVDDLKLMLDERVSNSLKNSRLN